MKTEYKAYKTIFDAKSAAETALTAELDTLEGVLKTLVYGPNNIVIETEHHTCDFYMYEKREEYSIRMVCNKPKPMESEDDFRIMYESITKSKLDMNNALDVIYKELHDETV